MPIVKAPTSSSRRGAASARSGGNGDATPEPRGAGAAGDDEESVEGEGGQVGWEGGGESAGEGRSEDEEGGGLLPLNLEIVADLCVNAEGRMRAIKLSSVKFNGQVCASSCGRGAGVYFVSKLNSVCVIVLCASSCGWLDMCSAWIDACMCLVRIPTRHHKRLPPSRALSCRALLKTYCSSW